MLAPSSNFAGALAEDLTKQGFAIIRHFTDERASDLLKKVVSATGSELPWRRSISAFSEIVLGSGSDGEILKFDELLELGSEHPEMASAMGWRDCIQPLVKICQTLHHVSERACGFRSTGHLAEVILRKGPATKSSSSILSLPQEHDIAEQLYFLRKRRLCMMSFIACEPGSMVTLTPNQSELDWQSVTMEVVVGMILIFRHDLQNYSYRPAGNTDLAVQAWIMEQDNFLKLEPVEGNQEDVMNFVGQLGVDMLLPGSDTPHIIGIGGSISNFHGPDQWHQASSISCDSVQTIPQMRWEMDMYYSPDLADGLSWCKHGSLFDVGHLDAFDNDFWNIQTGHVQKIMRVKLKPLEAGYEAAHDSGFTRATLRNAPIALGIGGHINGILPVHLVSMGTETTDHLPDSSFVSYHLGLTGKSMILDSACSSTMCITHELNKDMMLSRYGHLHELRDYGIANQALVIGSLILPGPEGYVGASQAHMMGSSGRSMSFDVSANGFGASECVMGFYMCRERSNQIASIQRAHVSGTSTNQDGRSASLTAPNGPAQAACIRQCLKNSGTTPQETVVNAPHCTGTKLGDPIELGSTRAALFSKSEDRPRPLSHCAFKSLTGHCFQAAAAPAIIQMIMSLQNAKVPPNCHLYEFNDNAQMSGYPALVGHEEYDMSMSASSVGLTGMGFGGSNARVQLMGSCKNGIRAIPPIMPLDYPWPAG